MLSAIPSRFLSIDVKSITLRSFSANFTNSSLANILSSFLSTSISIMTSSSTLSRFLGNSTSSSLASILHSSYARILSNSSNIDPSISPANVFFPVQIRFQVVLQAVF